MENRDDHNVKRRLSFRMPPAIPNIDDPDLEGLTNLIRNPFTGLVYRRRFDMVLQLLEDSPDTVLEIGYGAGFLTYNLAPHVDRYIGVDIHAFGDRVEKCMANSGINNIEYLQGDARQMDEIEDASCDAVVSVSCLEHIRECNLVQQEVMRILRPGGQAVYGVPVKNILTKTLFRLVGYDDEVIHPSDPSDVLEAARDSGLILEEAIFLPRVCGLMTGLYWAARFRKPTQPDLVRAKNTAAL